MIVAEVSRKTLIDILHKQILPRVADSSAPLLLASPPFAAGAIRITPHEAPLLRSIRQERSIAPATRWVEEGYNSTRYPTLMWIIEGEADYRVGVTRRMATQNKKLSSKHGYYVASLPAGSFFIVPPNIPISDGSRSHWERPHLQDAFSRLLWFHILPAGISFHLCSTQGAQHTSTRSLFLSEPRLLPLTEFLLLEMQNRATHSEDLARHYLMVLLFHIARGLEDHRVSPEEDRMAPLEQHLVDTPSTPLQRACNFMERHASQKLSLSEIAAHAYVSPPHLCRLFRAELNVTPGEYLTQLRLGHARSLLETTNLTIQHIGAICGYPSAEHFNRSFRRHAGATPGEFRRRQRP